MAKIVVNTRLLLKNRLEGIGFFTHETLKRITEQHPEHQFVFLFDRPFDEEFIYGSNVTPEIIGPPARHPFLWYLWFEFSVPKMLKKHKADLFLSQDGYLSLSTKVKQLDVIHDLNFKYHPQDLPFFFRHYYNYYFPKFAKKATRIATVSDYSKQDIAKSYGINPDTIDVVYNGVNPKFGTLSTINKFEYRRKFADGCPYFLFIGALHRRKNVLKMLEAFDLFREKTHDKVKLILAGNVKWWTRKMERTYQNLKHKEDVVITGRVEMSDLTGLMGAAHALLYVPYFEGFGIPIIEGNQSGIPVVTSNVTSMPEVAGDAAVLVDPFSAESIAEGMLKAYADNDLREELITKGFLNAERYSWQRTADLLWESIEKTLK